MLSFTGIIVLIILLFTRSHGNAGKQSCAVHVDVKPTQQVEESQIHTMVLTLTSWLGGFSCRVSRGQKHFFSEQLTITNRRLR